MWLISERRRWIEEHGDSRSGYVVRYGPALGDPTKPVADASRHGIGDLAICEADMSVLRDLDEQLKGATSRRRATTPR